METQLLSNWLFAVRKIVVCKLWISTTKTHPAYDYIAFTQVPKERFEELKKAFVIYDKDKSGKIKTTGNSCEQWNNATPRVDLINILRAASTHADHKSAKKYWQLDWIVTLLGCLLLVKCWWNWHLII